ncbi:MAG: DUF4190 domain-containing protein [Thermoleophilia bacterium]
MAPEPPPPPPPPPPSAPQQVVYVEKSGNGLAVAALVLGIVGTVMGLIPILFWIALPCGIVGVCLGIPAIRAAAERGRKGMAWAGTILSVIAIALGVAGVAIVNDAFSDVDKELERIQQELDEPR